MKNGFKIICGAVVLACLIFTACSGLTACSGKNSSERRVISYIRTWPLGSTAEDMAEGRHWTADDIKAEYLTDLNISFALINEEDYTLYFADAESEETPFTALWDEVYKLKNRWPKLRVNFSVGGWGADGFSDMAADPEKRGTFIASALDIIARHNLDGIDIDWEYPVGPDWGQEIKSSPADAENFILLLEELRSALNKRSEFTGKDYSVSIAVPASDWYVHKLNVVKIASLVDTMNVMTYDFYGSWSRTTGHNSNLYTNPDDPDGQSIADSMEIFLKAGVPASKLVAGLAFYGRGWQGVKAGETNGLFQRYRSGEYDEGLSWMDMPQFLDADSGFVRYWDDTAKAPYLYNGDVFISYTDEQSVKEIAQYAKKKKFGGVMNWEYGHDVDGELLKVLYENF